MANVKPTRSELIQVKKKIALASSGHKLLKKKRDGLILEFFNILKKARNMKQELIEEYSKAHHMINIARAIPKNIVLNKAERFPQ